uniref:Uncharacterized protein n=1 Tax=Tanacetum cinerariifolium TaxID=118510 RepID=A0A6L2K5L0_TANCI|nr:hypothetical protein [Tanacetum cinerariifolium]
MNQVLNENERLLEQIINKDIVNIVVIFSMDNASVNVPECKKCLKLETKLLNKKDFIKKETYNKLFKRYTTLEKHCISLEVDTQLNQEIFQRDNSVSNQSAPNFDQYFELNELKAQSQDKDMVIRKLKERIKFLSRNVNEDKVKKDIDEIETSNIELDHKVSKLSAKNEHLNQTYKQLYDSIKPTSFRSKEQCDALINQVNQKQTCPSINNSSEKLVVVTAKNKDKRVRFAEPVTSSGNTNTKIASSSNLVYNKPMLSSTRVKLSTSASGSQPSGSTKKDRIQQPPSSTQKNKVKGHPRTIKCSLKNKNCVVEPTETEIVQHSKFNANSKLICVKCNGCMLYDNHDLCVLNVINDVIARPKSKFVKITSKKKVWKPTGKVFNKTGYIWRPTGRTFTIVGNACPLTRITTTTEATICIHCLNINLQRSDAKITDAQKENVQANQVTKDTHVTLTIVPPAVQQQSSSVSSYLVSKFINLSADTESLGAEVLVRSTNQPQTSYVVADSLLEFELKKILIDKIEDKSIYRPDTQKDLYNAFVKLYNYDKDINSSYGDVVILKRGRDDQDKDEEPFESKSTSSSKGASRSQPKSSDKSGHVEKHGEKVDDLEDQPRHEFNTGNDDVAPIREAQDIDERRSSSQKYTTSITKTKATDYGQVKWIKDKVSRIWSPVKVVYDKHAYWGTYHWGPKHVIENGNSFKPVAETSTDDAGTSTGPITIEEKAKKKNDVKARSMFLMALPNEHLMTFNQYKDAKTFFAAIETRFGFRRFPNSTNEVPTVFGVSTASLQVSTANFSDATVYTFLANQPNGSQLMHEDLEQIHEDDLEEMDLKWQLALLKCFNCHKMGHFAREYKVPRNHENMTKNQETTRWTVNVEDISSKAMVAIDGAGFNWGYTAEDEAPTNMAFMALSDSEVYTDNTCSKTYLKNYATLKTQYNELRREYNKSKCHLANYERGLASVEAQLVHYQMNKSLLNENITVLKRDIKIKDSEIVVLKSKLEKISNEKDALQTKIEKFENASLSLDKLIESQVTDNSKKGLGYVRYNAIPPPHTRSYSPPRIDLSHTGLPEFAEPSVQSYRVKPFEVVTQKSSVKISAPVK